jgi:hypothetical protein
VVLPSLIYDTEWGAVAGSCLHRRTVCWGQSNSSPPSTIRPNVFYDGTRRNAQELQRFRGRCSTVAGEQFPSQVPSVASIRIGRPDATARSPLATATSRFRSAMIIQTTDHPVWRHCSTMPISIPKLNRVATAALVSVCISLHTFTHPNESNRPGDHRAGHFHFKVSQRALGD